MYRHPQEERSEASTPEAKVTGELKQTVQQPRTRSDVRQAGCKWETGRPQLKRVP